MLIMAFEVQVGLGAGCVERWSVISVFVAAAQHVFKR